MQHNLKAFANNDETFKWYQSALKEVVIFDVYQGSIPMAYTSSDFMCLGSGGETCMRRQYVYLLGNGDIVRAQICYWPFVDGEFGETDSRVEEVYMIYDSVLRGE